MKNPKLKVAKVTPKIKAKLQGFPMQDFNRNSVARKGAIIVGNNPNLPITPITCSGTSFQCDVPGSGKTRTESVHTYPNHYDMIGTPIKEGGMLNTRFQPNVVLNWQNNSIATKYTKESLKNTYGFENFQ